MRPKKRKGHNQLTIATRGTNHTFITDRVHKNLTTHCSNTVTALLEYLDLGILKIFGGSPTLLSPPPPLSAPGLNPCGKVKISAYNYMIILGLTINTQIGGSVKGT